MRCAFDHCWGLPSAHATPTLARGKLALILAAAALLVAGCRDSMTRAPGRQVTTPDGTIVTPVQAQARAVQPRATDPRHPFPRRIEAPEFPSDLTWLNTSSRVKLADLRGKFVLLDFWT